MKTISRLMSLDLMRSAKNARAATRCIPVALMIAGLVLLGRGLSCAAPADDPKAAARSTLDRIQTMRKERPGDGLLVFYQAIIHLSLGERETALELLRTLKGRKLGLIPIEHAGFDA